jgi:hypothetical protein
VFEAALTRPQRAAVTSALLTQLLELMGEDARYQPWTRHDRKPELLKQAQGIQLKPVLYHLAVSEAVEF